MFIFVKLFVVILIFVVIYSVPVLWTAIKIDTCMVQFIFSKS